MTLMVPNPVLMVPNPIFGVQGPRQVSAHDRTDPLSC